MSSAGSRRPVRSGAGVLALAALLASGVVAGSGTGVAAASGSAPDGGNPIVVTSHGALRGMTTGATDEFLGIPYAAPPVGPLRWRAPQPAARWSGVRDATRFAPHCAQPAGLFSNPSMSEDCLYLNVFTPAGSRTGARHPVMVWIHGGALFAGESDLYNPAGLVANGVTVVTINYRLGALGFLAHPALADSPGGPSGNYGLMDQQAALRWVQRDVARFGGDPRNVTVFGESAGGLSTLSQLASPGGRGLFDRAIVESGTYARPLASLAGAESAGETFASQAGCASQTADCLRGLPVSTILANENTEYEPDIDGLVLTQQLSTSFATGEFNRVPVIDGSNHDEWRLFVAAGELGGNPVTAANYQSMIASTLGVPDAVAAVIAARYPLSAYPSPAVALGAVGTDAIFACSARTVDNALSKFVPTFAYEFNDENAPNVLLPPVSFPLAASHAAELQYLFSLPGPSQLSADQQRLASTMRAYWTNFATRGFPSSFGVPQWPHYTSDTARMQSFVPPEPAVETNFATEHNCAFWAPAG